MKFLNKSLVPLMVAGSTLLFISCQEEDPIKEPDKEKPVVHLEMPETPGELSGEVILKATVEDNQEVERVSFYLDDELLGEATEEPFEIVWDSEELEDGSYILKVIATDKSGNKAEDSREVTVRNTLMSIHMEEGYRIHAREYDFTELWFFLSDKEGNIIGAPKKLNPGETISWNRPAGFTDEEIMINRFAYIDRKSTIFNPKVLYAFDSYADIPPSDMILAANFKVLEEMGSAEINIDNELPVGPDINFSARTEYSNTRPNYASGGEPVTLNPTMHEKEQQCLVIFTPNRAAEGEERIRNFYLMDIRMDENYTISTDLFTPMVAKEVSLPGEKDRGHFYLNGHLKDRNGKGSGFRLSSRRLEAGTLSANVYFPEGIFSEYTFEGDIYSNPHRYYYRFRFNTIPDVIAKPDFTATVNNADLKSVELNTNKKHDVGFIYWNYGETIDGEWEYVERRLYFGKEKDEPYVLPDVPEVLTKEYPIIENSLNYAGTVLYDYKDISSYQEYFNAIYGSNSDNLDLNYYEYLLLSNNKKDNSGGRLHSPDHQLPERILEYIGEDGILP